MIKKAKSLLKIGAIFLGTVLGAGFASGQELYLFFVRFGRRGLLGCLLAGSLFCLLGALILEKSYDLPEKNYKKYLEKIFGKGISMGLYIAMEVFLCISFCIMLSGSGAFVKERFSLPAFAGVVFTDLICLLVFLYDVKGLSALNMLLTPVMLLGTLYVCVYAILTNTVAVWLPQVHPHGRFLPYALFYVGYNMLTATAVLVPASDLAENKKMAKWGGVLGGVCLTLLAFVCSLALFGAQNVFEKELPLLVLSAEAGTMAHLVYSAVLYMAMLTTAVSTGFSVMRSMQSFGLTKRKSSVAVCLAALPLSLVEFSSLVRYCYVFFGVLGLLLVGGILWDWYKKV